MHKMAKNNVTTSKIIISVIGGHQCHKKVEDIALELGRKIGKMGFILVCGGLSGVMEAVSKGAKLAGGLTVGILPGNNKQDANPYIDIRLPTGIGYARNTIVVSVADVVVALPGETGTLSEIGFALNMAKPVIDLGGWNITGMIKAVSAQQAAKIIKSLTR
jgi:uncharacterized protein (TIGR00725 family)